jgi:hypothetical protein
VRRLIFSMSYRYPDPTEFAPTREELDATRTAAGAPQTGTSWGAGVGTVLGGLAGLLPLLAAQPELLPLTIPAGAAAGGALGSAVGGSVGGAVASGANEIVDAATQERNRKLAQLQMHQQALDALMNTK